MSTLTQEEVDTIMASGKWYSDIIQGKELDENIASMTKCLYCETILWKREVCACHKYDCQEGPLCDACMDDHIVEHIDKGDEA